MSCLLYTQVIEAFNLRAFCHWRCFRSSFWIKSLDSWAFENSETISGIENCLSKKSWTILNSDLLYKMGQVLLGILYPMCDWVNITVYFLNTYLDSFVQSPVPNPWSFLQVRIIPGLWIRFFAKFRSRALYLEWGMIFKILLNEYFR